MSVEKGEGFGGRHFGQRALDSTRLNAERGWFTKRVDGSLSDRRMVVIRTGLFC